jgi:hypothetical protein
LSATAPAQERYLIEAITPQRSIAMPLSKKDLSVQLSGLGDNSRVLLKSSDGKLYEVQKFDLENKALVLTQGPETTSGDDPTQQEAGAIRPSTDEVLHNTSGVSFAASGSARGIDQKTNAAGPDAHNTVQENLGTEQGSGAIASASGTSTGNSASGDGSALPIKPQPDAGSSAASGNDASKPGGTDQSGKDKPGTVTAGAAPAKKA